MDWQRKFGKINPFVEFCDRGDCRQRRRSSSAEENIILIYREDLRPRRRPLQFLKFYCFPYVLIVVMTCFGIKQKMKNRLQTKVAQVLTLSRIKSMNSKKKNQAKDGCILKMQPLQDVLCWD